MEMHRIQEIHREKVIHHPRERRRIGPIMNHSHRLLMTMSRQYRISRQIMEIVERLAKITNADGGILFAHWGCKGTIGASGLIKSSLEAAGLPTMILDGDGCNPANTSDGQVSTRLQAFVEMLEENREGKSHDTLCL